MGQPVTRHIITACLALAVAVGCKGGDDTAKPEPSQARETEPAKPPKPEPPPEPTPAQKIAAAKDLAGALKVITPMFQDTTGCVDPAAAGFALWCAKHLDWIELQSLPETTFDKVMKDSEAERGKRMCAKGKIVEIAVDRTSGVPVYIGGLITPARKVYRFVAVKDTGEIVQKSPARFCGVVTGRQSYANSAGGTTHAVALVGMFDLPANRTP